MNVICINNLLSIVALKANATHRETLNTKMNAAVFWRIETFSRFCSLLENWMRFWHIKTKQFNKQLDGFASRISDECLNA